MASAGIELTVSAVGHAKIARTPAITTTRLILTVRAVSVVITQCYIPFTDFCARPKAEVKSQRDFYKDNGRIIRPHQPEDSRITTI